MEASRRASQSKAARAWKTSGRNLPTETRAKRQPMARRQGRKTSATTSGGGTTRREKEAQQTRTIPEPEKGSATSTAIERMSRRSIIQGTKRTRAPQQGLPSRRPEGKKNRPMASQVSRNLLKLMIRSPLPPTRGPRPPWKGGRPALLQPQAHQTKKATSKPSKSPQNPSLRLKAGRPNPLKLMRTKRKMAKTTPMPTLTRLQSRNNALP